MSPQLLVQMNVLLNAFPVCCSGPSFSSLCFVDLFQYGMITNTSVRAPAVTIKSLLDVHALTGKTAEGGNIPD